jgi:hypothetical protein
MSKAAQGFPPRRTSSTLEAENPRRTQLIGKRAISRWELRIGRAFYVPEIQTPVGGKTVAQVKL